MVETQKYAQVGSMIDEELYSTRVDGEEQMLELHSDNYGSVWTKQIHVKIRVILSNDKIQTVKLCCKVTDKIMSVQEQIANLFGETKYSTSIFAKGKKCSANESL